MRNDLSTAKKLELLKLLSEPTAKRATIAKLHNCSQATLSRIVRDKEKLEALAAAGVCLMHARCRKLEFPRTDEGVIQWFQQMRTVGAPQSMT